jgi:hypothetical protein
MPKVRRQKIPMFRMTNLDSITTTTPTTTMGTTHLTMEEMMKALTIPEMETITLILAAGFTQCRNDPAMFVLAS